MNIEKVIVKDYGRQGLALFFPETPANRGHIDGWTTLIVYDKGDSADVLTSLMCGGECSMGYFLQGKKPKKGDSRIAQILARYKQSGVKYAEPTQQKVVFKDTAKMQIERWIK